MSDRKAHVIDSSGNHKFEFKKGFKERFDALVKAYTDALAALNKISISSEYGVCYSSYNLRYITPSNISTYIGNLIKGLSSGLFKDRIADVELFTVASIKKFIEENPGCVPFEDSTAINRKHEYVNPKEMTLTDLALLAENDLGGVCVYSKGEMTKRITLMKDDIKKLNDMHFAANIKKIVKGLPGILDKAEDGNYVLGAPAFAMIFERYVEEIIEFACTLNIIAVLKMYAYANPKVQYSTKEVDDDKKKGGKKVITECCLHKTNDYMIRTNMPFNCNLRDVVLQDVTPDFKDIHDALHFIMKDPRSPICLLVNKFATQDAARYPGDCDMVARVLMGCNHCEGYDELFKKDGERVVTGEGNYLDNVAGFESHVDWLDTIVFGNNYLDGNYRRDAVGNNKVHPITNALDMIFKMFGGCEYKTNEDIANNIIRNAALMKGIISLNRDGKPIANYDRTKDVLALVGEILTRNMLRLFYNNTHVAVISDDMYNAGPMPMMTMESFIMEADNNNNKNQPEVSLAENNGTNTKNNTNNNNQGFIKKISEMISKLIMNFTANYEKQYKKWIDEVNNNKDLNEKIRVALDEKKITATPQGWKMTLKADRFKAKTDASTIFKTDTDDPVPMALQLIGLPQNLAMEVDKQLKNVGKNEADKRGKIIGDAIFNYAMFEKLEEVNYDNTPLTGTTWMDDVVNEILQSVKFCDTVKGYMNENIQNGKKALDNMLASNETDKNKINVATEAWKLASDPSKGNPYSTKMLMSIGNGFFRARYKLYSDVVKMYQNQTNNTEQTDVNQAEVKKTPESTNGSDELVKTTVNGKEVLDFKN